MIVVEHRLCRDDGTPYEWAPSPTILYDDPKLTKPTVLYPTLLLWHYTAGTNSLPWLTLGPRPGPDGKTLPGSGVSAHLLVSRCGLIIQMVAFNRCAAHAGSASEHHGRRNCNLFAIGVEIENLGRLERKGDQWIGPKGIVVPDDQVIEATHKHELSSTGWHRYTPEQIEVARRIRDTLVPYYRLDTAGHDDVLASKRDPGPAWDL